jgi:hypothetical protein
MATPAQVGLAICGTMLCLAMILGTPGARAADTKYPDWQGQWTRIGTGQWDPSRTGGPRQQQAPLTPEYQAVLETGVADMAAGGHGNNPTPTCLPPGMPRAMLPYESMEFIIEPEATHISIEFMNQLRHIYTDGRDWPRSLQPTFLGYSIGHWEDGDGAGRYRWRPAGCAAPAPSTARSRCTRTISR